MGTFSVTLGTTANPRTRDRIISDADIARLPPALRAYFDLPLATNNELMDQLFNLFEGTIRKIVRQYEKDQARIAAEAGVVDIPIT